ncbi:MAG: SRPBCC domain-containing protein [Gammaproteobacteria bacterium]|nr:SRPBCC domain-containing protein [Gammaproteobacteria bacterium]
MPAPHGPNIENLRKQAKSLLRDWQRGESHAGERVAAYFLDAPNLGLQNIQLVLAREYGFNSWSALVDFVPRLGTFDDIGTFRINREFPVTSERLWHALSHPEEIEIWLLPVTFEPNTGAAYAFRSQPPMTGTLGEYHPQHAIRFDSTDGAFWRFAIEPVAGEGGSTRMLLTVEDRMTLESVRDFPGGPAKAWNPGVTAGWHEILDALEHHLTAHHPPPIDYPRLCKFYDRVIAQLAGQHRHESPAS